MAPRQQGVSSWLSRHWWVVLSLAGIVALAIYLRTAFNLPIFVERGGELAGNDPYYHLRVIRTILESGHHFLQDPMLNYPAGFKNVNPPTFNWTVVLLTTLLAPIVSAFGGGIGPEVWVQSFSPVIFGALAVLVVYLVTAEVFDRKSGVIAAFLMAIMASHIERSMFGFADHDSYVLFFITLGMFFYLKATTATRRREWIGSWTEPASVVQGLRAFADEGRLTLVYSAMAGVAFANVALAWKGFHYAVAIIFAYAVLQLILDHLRRETGLDIFVMTVVTLGVMIALAVPFYLAADMMRWFEPSLWIFIGFLVVSAFLVPTRDLPSILVLPAFVGFLLGGLAIIAVAIPSLSQLVFGGFGYFQQTSVYQTIAEAHPADFSLLVFNFGVATFYMALIGLVLLALRIRRDFSRGRLFMLAWAAVAIYMAIAATRFLFNASPVFAVMSGWMTWWVIDKLDFGGMARQVRGYGHDVVRSVKRAVGVSHVAGVIFLAFAIVVPNSYFAIDAGMPSEFEAQLGQDDPELQRFVQTGLGTFGQGYLPSFWRGGLSWLADQDTDVPPPDRPAFLSWWDYGFWATGIGHHPTVADNFQNNYFFAGRFLAAQNETHGMQVLVAGFMNERAVSRDEMRTMLADAGVDQGNVTPAIEALAGYEWTPHLDLDQSVQVYRAATERSGKIVRYFAVDQRLFPFDDPNTPQIDFNSIFYAPITLAEFDGDSFLEVKFTVQVSQTPTQGGAPEPGQQTQVTQAELQQLQNDPRFTVQVLGTSYEYKQKFFDTMLYRTYVGTPPRGQPPGTGALLPGQTQPCFNLQHWALAYQNNGLRICKFYFGATVEGRVQTPDGEGLPTVSVAVVDRFGIPHHTAFTDQGGNFTLTVPEGPVTVVAFRGAGQQQETIGDSGPINVTDAQAMEGAILDPVNITVEPGTVRGTVFYDRDDDGEQDPGEEPLEGATVLVGRRLGISDANGTYEVAGVVPGPSRVQATLDGYRHPAETVTVQPNGTTVHNVSMTSAAVPVGGVAFEDQSGDGQPQGTEHVPDVPIEFTVVAGADDTAENRTAQTDADGNYTVSLKPGDYAWSVNATVAGVTWVGEGTVTAPFGGDEVLLDVEVRRG